ncbi:unnamed protein product [Phytomonas sp. Hart1]|nr:unnamed protein product [Phytomonas sp. Hart1]|eukprot:CCW68955.1 unnamed protein product [Phytomonas sp. isolate Hart1]
MAEIGPRMPWGVWVRVHAKAILQALPLALLIVVEGRDLYYRATWQVRPVPPSDFRTGDVVLLCNRWYALPSWGQRVYSLIAKGLLKSAWEEVGFIIVRENHEPHLVYCDPDGVREEPLGAFLRCRQPRGAALRALRVEDGRPPPSLDIADIFMQEVRKNPPQPWYLFAASMRHGAEHQYYEFCVRMNKEYRKMRAMVRRAQTRQAIHDQIEQLREMETMREYLATRVERKPEFHLFNGSLVASFLATYGYLDRVLPSPSRYVPQDFAHDLPFTGSTSLGEPVVFFKT